MYMMCMEYHMMCMEGGPHLHDVYGGPHVNLFDVNSLL